MSRTTQDLLLDAAQALYEERGIGAVTMVSVARRAGLSRQAAYLNFEDRGALMVELVDRLDRSFGLEAATRRFMTAPTGEAALHTWAEMQATRNPRIAGLARALDALRHEDSAASRAWASRIAGRLRAATHIVGLLRAEGRLHPEWDADEAARLLCELYSIRVWDDLVNDFGLAPERYVERIRRTALVVMAAEP